MRVRRFLAVCSVGSLLGLGAVAPATANAPAVKVLLSGLSSPKGLAINGARELVIAQGAFGPPGPVVVIPLKGRDKGVPTEVTDPFPLTDIAIDPHDGTAWVIAGDQHLYHELSDGTIVDVLDIPGYQATDIDPVDQDMPPIPEESNPYGLTVDHHGNALVADAANNDLLRVAPDGTTVTVARFDVEAVATDHLPPDLPFPLPDPLPSMILAEAVPTTVVVGPGGDIYVGELKGFPFRPGTSHIWRIDHHAEDAWCSVNTPDPDCSVFSAGYTGIQDIAFNMNNGTMYVYELAVGGPLAFEAGFETFSFPPAVLLEVRRPWRHGGKRTELAAGELSEPGGIVVDRNGKVYVTDGVFTGGRVSEVRRGG